MIYKGNGLNCGISDKVMMPWLQGKEYIDVSNEGEAVAIGAGHFLATGQKANVFMSADGFMNALNFLTSWIIPDGIGMHFVISIGRMEKPHFVATEITEPIIKLLEKYDAKGISYEFVRKQ